MQNNNRHYYNGHYLFALMKFYDREAEQQLLRETLDQSKREARMTVNSLMCYYSLIMMDVFGDYSGNVVPLQPESNKNGI